MRSGHHRRTRHRGFAEAAVHAVEHLLQESARIASLRNELVAAVRRVLPQAHLSGEDPLTGGVPGQKRLPGNAHFTFENAEGDTLLFLLDMQGISSSTGSACNAGVTRPSHVLIAMGMDEDTGPAAPSASPSATRAPARILRASSRPCPPPTPRPPRLGCRLSCRTHPAGTKHPRIERPGTAQNTPPTPDFTPRPEVR